jgi:hypothetical protein
MVFLFIPCLEDFRRRVDLHVGTSVLEEHAASIFRIALAHVSSGTVLGELRAKATGCSKRLIPIGNCTNPHGVTFQMTGICTVTVVKTSDLPLFVLQDICIIQSWTVRALDPNTYLVTT